MILYLELYFHNSELVVENYKLFSLLDYKFGHLIIMNFVLNLYIKNSISVLVVENISSC